MIELDIIVMNKKNVYRSYIPTYQIRYLITKLYLYNLIIVCEYIFKVMLTINIGWLTGQQLIVEITFILFISLFH